jgi:hypothetical protein
MEILGHALVDMRDAPDAQVVLEIAIVQAARPDLDQSTAALSERVSALERSAVVAHPAPPLERSESAKAPAEAADVGRQQSRVGRQPSIGAIIRSRNEPAPAERDAEAVPPSESEVEPTVPDHSRSTARTESAVDRDSVTQAWGDGVLHGLSARAKALYSVGRFVAVDGQEAKFALPNAAHRDKCLERVTEVEAALGAHFGTPIRLVLIVDGVDGGSNGAVPPPSARPSVASEPEDILEDEDPEVLDAVQGDEDHQASAVDRLLRTFPGASEVDE